MKNNYSPDILNCLANLSSDEVFTSPELANRMLDLLPQELFRSSKTRFLDPCSKSGVFLREIAKRLLAGLEEQIPDLQQRIDHIMTKQVFGIACTDLTAEMSRRTLYCTKQANGEYSVATCFDDAQGNLRYMRCQHTWENGKCRHCGANRAQYDRVETIETYAYPFIHKSIQEILKKDMQFDVIIGNPPYQMSDGGQAASAKPIYQLFVEQAMKLQPRYLCMIIPARWYAGGKGLDQFRSKMLGNKQIKYLVDYSNSADCFPGVNIAGGVCYFLWDKSYKGKCEITSITGINESTTDIRDLDEFDVLVRNNTAVHIIRKMLDLGEKTLDKLVASYSYFAIRSYEEGTETRTRTDDVRLHSSHGIGYFPLARVTDKHKVLGKHKVIITYAMSGGNKPTADGNYQVISTLRVLKPNEVCTETYLVLSTFDKESSATNLCTYVKTKTFRFLLLQALTSIHITKDSFRFVPLQDFSHPWTDEMLYKKYDLDKDEIAFIESMIRPME